MLLQSVIGIPWGTLVVFVDLKISREDPQKYDAEVGALTWKWCW